MESIQWNVKRRVFIDPESGDVFVKTGGGYMEFEDYRQHGGRVEHFPVGQLVEVGTFTNAEISNMDYPQ